MVLMGGARSGEEQKMSLTGIYDEIDMTDLEDVPNQRPENDDRYRETSAHRHRPVSPPSPAVQPSPMRLVLLEGEGVDEILLIDHAMQFFRIVSMMTRQASSYVAHAHRRYSHDVEGSGGPMIVVAIAFVVVVEIVVGGQQPLGDGG